MIPADWVNVLGAAWRSWTNPYDPNHPDAAAFRSLQVQATLAITPWVLFANGANIAVIGWTFRHQAPAALLVPWMAATTLAALAGVPAWRRWRAGRWPAENSHRTLNRVTRHAFLLAALWALPIALGYAGADERPLLIGVTVGMICAGGFAMAPVPRAAFAYVATLSCGLAAGFVSIGPRTQALLFPLLIAYAGIVLATVVTSARQLGRRLAAEAESTRQKRVVDMLLDDFQENARDWLWEIDATGALQHVSPRLVEAFGLPHDALHGRRLSSLIDDGEATSDDGRHALDRVLGSGTAFRDLQVAVTVGGQRRWWSLTGKRLFDDAGRAAGWRGVGTDVTRHRQHRAELVRLANIDPLTGLANRHHFSERLAVAAGRPFTLFYLDLDDFKAVNDVHGHVVGDRALRTVAARFRAVVRDDDVLARVGGDEFALISWDTVAPDSAAAVATRLIGALRAPIVVEDITLRLATCIGIVQAHPTETSEHGLTRLADMALYDAKAQGRNTYRFFHASMEEAALQRLALIDDLHKAVERSEFVLHYQPIVDISSGALTGAEALLRWQHPTRGRIAPLDFISLAEETGLIVPIGRWVVREACRAASVWPEHLRVSVNLSALQFTSPTLVQDLQAALHDSGLLPGRLVIEITESMVVRDVESARATLRTLRSIGVRVAIDDFGTGHSSLGALRSLALDAIKIDRAFIADLPHDRQAEAVLRAIVGLAQALGLAVTVEGVERSGQREALRRLGVLNAQGFLIGRPLPETDLGDLFDARMASVAVARRA